MAVEKQGCKFFTNNGIFVCDAEESGKLGGTAECGPNIGAEVYAEIEKEWQKGDAEKARAAAAEAAAAAAEAEAEAAAAAAEQAALAEAEVEADEEGEETEEEADEEGEETEEQAEVAEGQHTEL